MPRIFRRVLALLGATLAVNGSDAVSAAEPAPKIVLELFTSQGCSSCPPADALLREYIKRDDVVALSLPVDYWDRLGWKDTYAKPEFTRRQYDYAEARGDSQVYTPQIVVNGTTHAVGSSPSRIDAAIGAAQAELKAEFVTVSVQADGGQLAVKITGGATQNARFRAGDVLLAVVDPAGTVAIRRGENAGANVTYHNVVRSLVRVGRWTGGDQTLRIELKEHGVAAGQEVAVLLQGADRGPILGAAQISAK